MEHYNFRKSAKLYLLCKEWHFEDALKCVYFDDGNAIATNGQAILVCPIHEISNLSEEDIKKLQGHLINMHAFKKLLRFNVIRVDGDGIAGLDENANGESKYFFTHPVFPDYKKVMTGSNAKADKATRFMAEYLKIMCDIAENPFAIIEPHGTNAGIKVSFKDSDIKGMIMPCLIND